MHPGHAIPLIPLAALACSGTSSPPSRAVILAAVPSGALPTPLEHDPAATTVVVARAPARLILDGDLAEWGSILPPSAQPAPASPPDSRPTDAGPPSDPNPRDAPSHVAMAITPEGALLAAHLAGEAPGGVWLALDTGAAPLAPLASYARWGVQRWVACMATPGDKDYDPDKDPGCQAVKEQADQIVEDHERRFRRMYRIDRQGIRVVQDGGKLFAVEGAKVGSRPAPGGVTIEAWLPAKALPRVAEAPWVTIAIGARAALGETAPSGAPFPLIPLHLPYPVALEPWAALRAKLFEVELHEATAPGLSYQPGDPLHIESMVYPGETERGWRDPRDSLAPRESPIYTRQASIGGAEIGLVASRSLYAAVLKKGEFVGLFEVKGRVMGLVERDGEIHLLSCFIEVVQDSWTTWAVWSVIAVSPNGTVRQDVVETGPGEFDWDEVSEHHEKALDTFGLHGRTGRFGGGEEGRWYDVTWHWDRRAHKYTGQRREVAARRSRRGSAEARGRVGPFSATRLMTPSGLSSARGVAKRRTYASGAARAACSAWNDLVRG
jgi:hypothetical protein